MITVLAEIDSIVLIDTAVLAVAEATWFGIAAALSSMVGVVLAVLSHRAGRKAAKEEAAANTHEQLLAARAEAERLSAELHALKIERDRDAEG